MAEHTPGPWTVEECKTSIWSGGYYIAEIYHNEADAPLIAAAPLMLRALKLALVEIHFPGKNEEMKVNVSQEIRAAIAKAEGK